ncbi:MAG: hypothetical protein QM487_00745 [Candidatus Marithrix sp.]
MKFIVIFISCIFAGITYAGDSYTYDELNRLIAVTNYETAQITRYTYDAGGNMLTSITVDLPKYDLGIYTKDEVGNPLTGVAVTINNQTIVSDENGYLQLTDLLADTYMLIANKNLHNFTAQEIIVGENSEIDVVSDGLTKCQLYAVHDRNKADSQFLTMNFDGLGKFDIQLLGSLYENHDIEAMDAHPQTGQIFVTAGDDGGNPGRLYLLNAQIGGLTVVGDTGFNEINGLSFTPDGVLWGAAETDGLIQIDPVTAISSLIIPYAGKVEDISWDNAGKVLYAIQDKKLVAYNSQAEKFTIDCPLPNGEIEALEMLPDNRLLLGIHDDENFSIYALDVDSCEIEIGKINPSTDIYKPIDIEGIAWPEVCF